MRINEVNKDNISFKGSIYSNKKLLNTLKFASDKAPIVAGGATLFLSTFVRPLSVMLTPKADKKEKQYVAAKSISSGLISFALTTLAFNPVSKAVDTISQNPQNYLKQATIDNLKISKNASKPFNFMKQTIKYSPSIMTVIPKALLTTALITPIIELVFDKKQKKVDKSSQKESATTNDITFKGLQEHLTKDIAKLIDNPSAQRLAVKYQDMNNLFHHSMTFKDMFATGCFALATKFNKKIDEKIKKPLVLNSMISTALTISLGYAINQATKKPTEQFIEKLSKVNQADPNLSKYIDGVRVLKPILILGTIYYALIPALSTFASNKLASDGKQKNV